MLSKCIYNSFLEFLLRFGFYLFAFPVTQRRNLFCVCFSLCNILCSIHLLCAYELEKLLSVFTQNYREFILYFKCIISLFNISVKQIPFLESKSFFPKISLPQFHGVTVFSIMFSPRTANKSRLLYHHVSFMSILILPF
jgi:hypothetical protein